MKNLTIKMKLILIAAIATIGFTSIAIFMNKIIHDFHTLAESELLVEKLEVELLELRKYEKDFLVKKDLKYKDIFIKTVMKLEKDEKLLLKDLEYEGIDSQYITLFLEDVFKYEKRFLKLVEQQQKIGLNEKDGLYGSLRASVHKVQQSAKDAKDNDLLALVYELRKEEKDFMLRKDLKYVDRFKTKIDSLINSSLSDANGRKANLRSYKKDFLALAEAEKVKGLNDNEGLIGEMLKIAEESEEVHHKMLDEVLTQVEEKFTVIKIESFALVSVFMILVLIIVFIISRNINASISTFQKGLLDFFKYLNKETDTTKELDASSKDEIGLMAKVVNENIELIKVGIEEDKKVIEEVVSVMNNFQDGDLSQRINVHTSNKSLQKLSSVMNNMGNNLENNISRLLDILDEYSNYNYINRVETNGIKEHLLKLANGVNSLGGSITKMLQDNKQNGLTINGSSSDLLGSVKDLNEASTKAAASLEETAAALEEINSTVTSSSQKIVTMSKLAQEVTSSTNQGQQLASKTTSAMDEINNQVTAINDAITVIDQIAFQTNILSLNAAVEAATAGEAGKGFAVVAAEVRNLASRSAEAAKEIKELVENANIKANEGKNIADEMINGYEKLSSNISQTTELINDISQSSKEQQLGVSQINDAINSLDKQTQQNAATASSAYDIANDTYKLSEDIVEDANKKEFEGKDSIKAPSTKNYTTSTSNKVKSEAPIVKELKVEKEKNTAPSTQTFTSSSEESDEWESF